MKENKMQALEIKVKGKKIIENQLKKNKAKINLGQQ